MRPHTVIDAKDQIEPIKFNQDELLKKLGLFFVLKFKKTDLEEASWKIEIALRNTPRECNGIGALICAAIKLQLLKPKQINSSIIGLVGALLSIL